MRILIEPAALMHVIGTTMDFVEDRIKCALDSATLFTPYELPVYPADSPAVGLFFFLSLDSDCCACNGYFLVSRFMFLVKSKLCSPLSLVLIRSPILHLSLIKSALLHLALTQLCNPGHRSEFVFKNPNSKGSCGCGESFTT